MDNLTIRRATVDDAPAIGSLIHALLPYLTVHPLGLGAEKFIANVGIDAQRRYLGQDSFRYHVALRGEELLGVVAVRDNTHLFHLFIKETEHGKGLGRRLWELARDDAMARGNPGAFTVNSAASATGLYLRLGFVQAGEPIEHDGIVDVPMRWESVGA
ncbi:GNAT family N-acetyltransferase [Pseudoduganella umbonata]|uniref:GNAT family N-acetyltransferase n=1 Tax=Pseudoduganella umbonata TaxID=864828 RepID=A0A4P8HNR9_9BURK|nr:GNAT family N-acetyltransferase [Pseudoduganella umbonata]MBB3224282.1 GNAT superfamily N-acetyltransferase [Pseudoduganella umbonata]QCP11337.1 GNAT family N-acetyltransferase [Pseudoduganella umbonata]